MSIYFTKYAEQKFEILNKHKVYITREQVESAVKIPDKARRKGKIFSACKDGVEVLYKKEGEASNIITFFPIKC